MRVMATSGKRFVSIVAALVLPALVGLAGVAGAYDRYSVNKDATNCRGCHGDFRATAPYTSASDGVAWKHPSTSANLNLHDGHRTFMLSGACNVCHLSGRFPTYTNQSAGITGYAAIGCIGCHGREESPGVVTGAGLRQKHFRAGETVCLNCHTDSDPAAYTPKGESVAPPFYFVDAATPNKPVSSCNADGSESLVAPPKGLDNDGDTFYDTADSDCGTTPVEGTTWGYIKSHYR